MNVKHEDGKVEGKVEEKVEEKVEGKVEGKAERVVGDIKSMLQRHFNKDIAEYISTMVFKMYLGKNTF